MPAHKDSQHLAYMPQQMFDMVADVARYPEFIPWVKAARIMKREGNEFLAELVISYSGLSESYTSRVIAIPHESIEVEMVKGPFEYLTNSWRFTPEGSGTRIDFSVDFKFKSRLLEGLMGGFFTRATAKMVDAFRARAAALYGQR